eukprot:12163-Heterococcus_DN1.PRE.2
MMQQCAAAGCLSVTGPVRDGSLGGGSNSNTNSNSNGGSAAAAAATSNSGSAIKPVVKTDTASSASSSETTDSSSKKRKREVWSSPVSEVQSAQADTATPRLTKTNQSRRAGISASACLRAGTALYKVQCCAAVITRARTAAATAAAATLDLYTVRCCCCCYCYTTGGLCSCYNSTADN